jgi:glutathione synthase/RimK-type ligase-like ATP-grasp enzyme
MPRIALATCAEFPDLFTDDEALRAALLARGAVPVPAIWDDPSVAWDAFDLVVVRSTWDYVARRDAFVAWARSVPRLANSARVVEWNTDKTYLRGLADAGVPVVPTAWVTAGSLGDILAERGWSDVVVKPAISAGAANTLRCNASDLAEGQALLDRIDGTAMVQPYLPAVEGYGERSLLFAEGAFTHAVRRNPALSLEGHTRFDARLVSPTDTELALAHRVLAAVGEPLLYARVDLVPDDDGNPMLMELEVTEPQLFLRFSTLAAEALADAIVARAGSAGTSTTNGS